MSANSRSLIPIGGTSKNGDLDCCPVIGAVLADEYDKLISLAYHHAKVMLRMTDDENSIIGRHLRRGAHCVRRHMFVQPRPAAAEGGREMLPNLAGGPGRTFRTAAEAIPCFDLKEALDYLNRFGDGKRRAWTYWNAVSAFANCGRAVAHAWGSCHWQTCAPGWIAGTAMLHGTTAKNKKAAKMTKCTMP